METHHGDLTLLVASLRGTLHTKFLGTHVVPVFHIAHLGNGPFELLVLPITSFCAMCSVAGSRTSLAL